MADEYIKFIYNFDYYISIDKIIQIDINDSKYSQHLLKIKYPGIIGKIGDLEVLFLHYDNIDIAMEKWNRRKKRINKNFMIFKFNDQNLCEYRHLKAFNEFKAKNKICFTAKHYEEFNTIQLKKFERYESVLIDIDEKNYKENFDMYKYVNNICERL